VRVRARLYRYQATGQVDDKTQLTPSRELLSQHCLFSRIAAVKLEHFLCQIVPTFVTCTRLSGATPAKAAIWPRERLPSSGRPAISVEHSTGPTPGGNDCYVFFGAHEFLCSGFDLTSPLEKGLGKAERRSLKNRHGKHMKRRKCLKLVRCRLL
jgi:hypothetical protein